MSTTALLIALFTAAQAPTPKNCLVLYRGLVSTSIHDALDGEGEVHIDEDFERIKVFAQTKCKLPKDMK